jgi:hypothetical protein
VITGPAAAVLAVRRHEGGKVELLDGIEDEPREVVLRQPLRNRRGHEIQLVTLHFSQIRHDQIVARAIQGKVDCHYSCDSLDRAQIHSGPNGGRVR